MIDVNNVDKHRRQWLLYYLVALYVHIFIFESKIFETTFDDEQDVWCCTYHAICIVLVPRPRTVRHTSPELNVYRIT